MSTATFTSNLPTIAASARKEFGPEEILIEKSFLRKIHRPLTRMERISYLLGCTTHNFSWPQTRQDVSLQVAYPWHATKHGREQIFDAHQTCTCCGIQRFFNSKTFQPGPYFKWTDAGAREERQQRPFDVFVREEAEVA